MCGVTNADRQPIAATIASSPEASPDPRAFQERFFGSCRARKMTGRSGRHSSDPTRRTCRPLTRLVGSMSPTKANSRGFTSSAARHHRCHPIKRTSPDRENEHGVSVERAGGTTHCLEADIRRRIADRCIWRSERLPNSIQRKGIREGAKRAESAVDFNIGRGDKGCCIAAEPKHRRGDFVGAADASERMAIC